MLVLTSDVVQRADVRMVQAGDGLRFALEALLHFGVVGEMRREDLDRHGAVQPRVGRLVDFAHPARADQREDLVGTESDACGQSHRFHTLSGGGHYTGGKSLTVGLIHSALCRKNSCSTLILRPISATG